MSGKLIFKTKRCIVREFTADDLDDLYRLYEPKSITRFVEPLFERKKEERYQENYRRIIYGEHGYGIWAVCDRATGELIGRMGVEDLPGIASGTVELGYIVAEHRQREGIAFEVCSAILDYTRDVLHIYNVQAHVHPDNTPSIRLLDKLGFTPTGRMEDGEMVYVEKNIQIC